jgi:hypothetical protein
MRQLIEITFEHIIKPNKKKHLKNSCYYVEFITMKNGNPDFIYSYLIDSSISAEEHFLNIGNGLIAASKKMQTNK